MKPILFFLAVMTAVGGSGGAVLAHPGHKESAPAPDLGEDGIRSRAKEEVARLVTKKKLEESWKTTEIKGLEKRTYKKTWEWVATFENAGAKKEKVLYVFLKPTGQFVAANFTGK